MNFEFKNEYKNEFELSQRKIMHQVQKQGFP